jgi:hypothetical protein
MRIGFICCVAVFLLADEAAARVTRAVALATSARDPDLIKTILAMSPTISASDADRVAECAYTTGQDLRREWQVVWPPGLQNLLVHSGARKGGLCFHWAEELLVRLYLMKLQTIDLHWAEAYPSTGSEHNVIVVTAKGQPFASGVLLDNWRYGGRLAWTRVGHDAEYAWQENPQHARYVILDKFRARTQPATQRAATKLLK